MAVEIHPHHDAARRWMDGLPASVRVLFNRATQTSFLRLLTQPIAPGYTPVSQSQAWSLYDRFLEDDRVLWAPEPDDLETFWRRFAEHGASAPKLWMDAYLAAFSIAGGYGW
jgi:toxin-antitoxin system PIN domain toxin